MPFAFPDLKRPQYPSSPEILLSALAWSVVQRPDENAETGLIYFRKETSAKRGVKIVQTMPRGDALSSFRLALESMGMRGVGGHLPEPAAEATAYALLGARPPKGIGYASSGIGLAGALLQDPVGGLATKNPPNFANLINTMYALGGSEMGDTAASKWFAAATAYSKEKRLCVIEQALLETTLKDFIVHTSWPPSEPLQAKASAPAEVPNWWQESVVNAGVRTPFSWFRTSWDRLCSAEWSRTLPPRRWSGWAVCVLRNALGFAFLWEANFYVEIAKGVVDSTRDPQEVARWSTNPRRPLIPYQRGGLVQMDVMPSLRRLLTQGLACRKAIIQTVGELEESPQNLAELIVCLRKRKPAHLIDAIAGSGEKGGLQNVIETVRYALLARGAPETPDNYALMKVVGRRYTHVAPAPEWIVVMAAMAAESPVALLRLGDVQKSLEEIGFKPRMDFLLGELEKAGLCASAADGDEGIEINLGFGKQR